MEKEKFVPDEYHVPEDEHDENNLSDVIPTGTFYVEGNDELTKERIFAIRLVEKLGNELAKQHPEIVELYKDPNLRLIDIAYRVFSKEQVDRYPGVCSKAVGFAIRQLNPAEDQQELTRLHRSHRIEMTFDFSSPEFLEQCREAAKRRHELHGVDAEAMIRGRGREPWTMSEKALVVELTANPSFHHQSGSMRGTPDYAKIAAELNRLFHSDREVRTANSVGSLVRDLRRKKRQVEGQ